MSYWENKLYFVFNDHLKNFEYEVGDKISFFNKGLKSFTSLVIMDQNGNHKRERLFSIDDKWSYIRPSHSMVVKDNEMILFGHSLKSKRLAKVTFK